MRIGSSIDFYIYLIDCYCYDLPPYGDIMFSVKTNILSVIVYINWLWMIGVFIYFTFRYELTHLSFPNVYIGVDCCS